MRRAEKVENVGGLQNDLGRATLAVLAEYRGLTAGQMNKFRRAVREAQGRCRVAKNTLAKRAVASSRYEKLTPMLNGPVALILAFKDPVALAKLTVKFADELPKLEIRGAVLDGQMLPPAEVKAGKVEFRVEKAGIVHVPIGKRSFGAERLTENAHALLTSLLRAKPAASKGNYMQSVAVSTTMGPGIRIDPATARAAA